MAASSYYATVQKAYIAFYGRPADPNGLTYWATRIDAAGGNISSIIQAFGTSAEATSLYGGMSNAQAVNTLYQQIFGRDADVTGLNFYVTGLLNGSFTLVDIAQRIIDGARGDDATIVANKLTAAQSFTDAINTAAEIVGYAGDTAAGLARDWLGTVGASSASLTSATAAIEGAVSNIAENGGLTATTTALTTDVETVNGTTGNDAFTAHTRNSNQTLNTGDIVNGGRGTDTLTLVAEGAAATVELNAVENVNVRLLSAQSFDTLSWSGVQNVSITNDSTNDTKLTLTNASLATTFGVKDDNDLEVSFVSTAGSGDTAKLRLDTAGSSGDNAAVTFNGALEAVTITNSGTSFVTLDASAASVTVVGNGNLTLETSDVVSGLSYAGFSGTTTTTVNAASNLAFTGGAGNDTLTITGLTSADSLQGGAGTDTLLASYSTATNIQNVSGFEVAKFALTETSTTFAMQDSQFTTLEIRGVSAASSNINISGVANGVNIDLDAVATNMNNLNIGYQSGAVATIRAIASGASDFTGATTISGAGTVTLTAVGASATQAFSGLSITDATSVTLAAGGSGTLDLDGILTLTDATSLRATVSGVGSLTQDADIVASGLTSITAVNEGSSTTSLWLGKGAGSDAFSLNSGSHTIVANAGVGDLELGSVTVGDGARDTITITVGNGGRFNSAGGFAYVATSGTVSLNVTQGTSSTATLSTVNAGSSGTISDYNVTVGLSGVFSAGNVTARTVSGLSITAAREASATIGAFAVNNIGNISLSQAASGSVIVGEIIAATGIGNVTVSGGDAATITLAKVSGETIGNISGKVGSAGTLTFTEFVADSGTFGAVTLEGGSGSQITLTRVSAAASASATDTVGSITLLGSGDIDSDIVRASGSIGALTVADGVSGTFGEIATRAMGAITISGDGFSITKVSATTVGNIALAGSANSITLAGALTTVGTVSVTGSGAQTVNLASATTVGTINLLGASANTLIASNVKNAITVNLGTGTNSVYVGTGGATINATAATGDDKLYLAGSANDGITVSNFELLGSGGDSINLSTAGFSFGFASATSFGSAVGGDSLSVVVANSAGTTVSFATAAGSTNTDVFVLATGSYTSITGALATLGTLVSASQADASAAAGSDILVLWYDSLSDSTKLTLVNATAGTMQKTFTSTFNGDTNTLITFSGIDIRGATGDFSDMFKAY